MKLFKIFGVTLATALFLAGCSGGTTLSGSGGGGGGGGGPTVAKVTVSSSASTIAADGSTSATITAIAVDGNNVAVPSVAVTFGATSGGVLQAVAATTDASGTATATLKAAAGVVAGTAVTVTVSAGGTSGSTIVTVIAIQQTISLTTDLPQIPSDASKSATISALLRDANNNALPGVVVQFSSTSGVLTVTQATTDQNGIAKATLNAGSDPTNRSITVNAGSSSGAATASLPITVTGTSLTLSGPANLVQGSSGSFAVVLSNSSGQGIANRQVTLSSASGNTLSVPSLITDASGRGTFTVTGAVGGQDTISATALGLVQTTPVSVSTQSFQITAPANNTNVNLGSSQTVTVTWLNNGTPVVGQPVSFATTRGTLVPATAVNTDANGQASVSISSASAGTAIVAASAAGVTAQITVNFIALTPSQIALQAGPASVAVQGQSTITAQVRDAANNLVQGATVNFNVTADPTNGGLSVPSATTDAQGRAQTVYTAGNTASGANGVTIKGTVAGTAITAQTAITVGGQTAFLSLGTGNTIDVTQGVAIYQITYTVFAVDTHGAPLSNQPITVSVLPVAYGKGKMIGCPGGQNWFPSYTTSGADPDAYQGKTFCLNEDTDYTGNISSLGVVGGIPVKDYNNNGKLDPGNIAVVSPSSGNTDANGRLDVKVTYPRDHAYWVYVTLKASTTTNGTESSATSTFVLPGAVADYACGTSPPGPVSEYGVGTTCANPN